LTERATYPVDLSADLVYSTVGGRPLLLDLYLPSGAPRPMPVIVWLHAGGWRSGNRKQAPDLSRHFVTILLGHADVEQRDVVAVLGESRQRGLPVMHQVHLVAFQLQQDGETLCRITIVIGQQDAPARSGGASRAHGFARLTLGPRGCFGKCDGEPAALS
jgi:hypothetical protein